MGKRSPRLAGFTLIEVVVASTISVALGVMLLYIMVQGNEVFASVNFNQQRVSATLEANKRIANQARLATAFPASTVIDSKTYTAGPQTLIITLASIDSVGRIICPVLLGDPTPTDTIVFTKDDTANDLLEISRPDPGGKSSRLKYNRIALKGFSTLDFELYKPLLTDHTSVVSTVAQKYRNIEQQSVLTTVARND